MLIRPISLAVLLVLCACGEEEEIACCAIEPKAKCESALHGMGIARPSNGQPPAAKQVSLSQGWTLGGVDQCHCWRARVKRSSRDAFVCASKTLHLQLNN